MQAYHESHETTLLILQSSKDVQMKFIGWNLVMHTKVINVDYNDLVSTFIMGSRLIGDFSNRPKKFKKCLCRYFGCPFHSSGNPFSEL